MTKFIELTSQATSMPILINLDQVVTILKRVRGVEVRLTSGTIVVDESYDHLIKNLKDA